MAIGSTNAVHIQGSAPSDPVPLALAKDPTRLTNDEHVLDAGAVGVGTAALAIAGSLTPSSFRRTAGTQLASSVILGAMGWGVGYGLATPINNLGRKIASTDDPTTAAVVAGGSGLSVWGLTRVWARFGPESTRIRPVIGSVAGVLGLAGLAGAAVLGARKFGDDQGWPDAAGTALGAAAIVGGAVGALAITGRLHNAPTTLKAARQVELIADEAIKGITPQMAKEMYAEKMATATARYLDKFAPGDAEAMKRMGRPGKLFVTGVATIDEIEKLSEKAAVAQPERIYVGIDEGDTLEETLAIAKERLLTAGVLDRGHVLVIAPTATGAFHQAVPFSAEVMTGGDIVSIAIQTSNHSPVLTLQRLPHAGRVHRALTEMIHEMIASNPASTTQLIDGTEHAAETQVLGHGVSYGAWAFHRAFLNDGIEGAAHLLDHGYVAGTPALSLKFRRAIAAAERSGDPRALVLHSSADAQAAYVAGKNPSMTWINNDDDPLRIRFFNFFRAPTNRAQPEAKKTFLPGITMINEALDAVSDARRLKGGFAEVGHDYRAAAPRGVRAAFGFEVSDRVVDNIETHLALQERLKLRSMGR